MGRLVFLLVCRESRARAPCSRPQPHSPREPAQAKVGGGGGESQAYLDTRPRPSHPKDPAQARVEWGVRLTWTPGPEDTFPATVTTTDTTAQRALT